MATAFVLLNVNLGTKEGVLARLRKREGVKEAHQVYGVYHIIARLSGGSKILRRLALYMTKEGAHSKLPERTPTQIREP